ncbi:MarR family winged helix-turn-helix transcriptional regulator [Pararhodobacter oceanensis]|nr:MarR family transcriptional regulator [Pararhodobacter oceanensis]
MPDSDTHSQTQFHQMPGYLIRRLNQISTSIFQDRMAALQLDLTPVQFAALSALQVNPGIDQATLAGLIAYDRVTIGGVIDRLSTKGLVARSINARDRRARQVSLTPEGNALLHRITPEVAALQPSILDGLTEAERALFIALAQKAAAASNDRSRAPLRPRKP